MLPTIVSKFSQRDWHVTIDMSPVLVLEALFMIRGKPVLGRNVVYMADKVLRVCTICTGHI